MAERNLHTILDGFQKMELEDLGNILGTQVNPRMRKSQLVEHLDSYIHKNPRRWMSHLMERDVKLLRDLVHAGPEKVQYQDFADYPSILEVMGLVQWDDSDEHYHKVWISREMYEIVAPDIDKVLKTGEKSGQFEVERVGLGYLNLYGVIPTERFIELLTDWFEQAYPNAAFIELSAHLQQSPLVKMYRYTDQWGDYVCSPCVENPEEIFAQRKELKQKRYKHFTHAEARDAGRGAPYFTIGLKTPEGMRLEEMYRRLGYEGYDLVKAHHDTWLESQYTLEFNDGLFQPLADSPLAPELSRESWIECCKIVCAFADSVPKWFLCGNTAAKTGIGKTDWENWASAMAEEPAKADEPSADYPQWNMPEPTVSEGFGSLLAIGGLPFGFSVPHVASDDPCPCGSGLKYKNCHGKYLS